MLFPETGARPNGPPLLRLLRTARHSQVDVEIRHAAAAIEAPVPGGNGSNRAMSRACEAILLPTSSLSLQKPKILSPVASRFAVIRTTEMRLAISSSRAVLH